MNRAVAAAGDEEIAHAIERQAARIHQRSDERLHAVIRGDLVKRNGNTLAPRAGKRDVNVAVQIDRGIRDGMKVVRDLQADVHGMRRAFVSGRGGPPPPPLTPFPTPPHPPIIPAYPNPAFPLPPP